MFIDSIRWFWLAFDLVIVGRLLLLVSDKFSIEQFTRLGLVLADIPAGLLL